MKNVWFISGLGTDEKAFSKLDFSLWNAHFVHWISPLKNESLPEYAYRLSEQITDENPIIVGYSFGGMLAVEIAKIRKTKKIIILASAKTRKELPPLYRAVSKMPFVWSVFTPNWIKRTKGITYKSFRPERDFEKKLLQYFMDTADPEFLIWGMRCITEWQNQDIPDNIIHIHGTKDKVLPFKWTLTDIPIYKGNHLMVINKFEEVNKILTEIIQKIS